MRQFGFFHPWVLSFFSRELYRDVARNWKGVCFLYLFVTLAVLWLVTGISIHVGIAKFADEKAPELMSKVPLIKIVKGQLQVDVAQPYIVTDPTTKQPIIIIDTTGQYTSLNDTPAKLLVTATSFTTRDDFGKVQTVPLSLFPDFNLDEATMKHWLEVVRKWAAIVVVGVGFPCSVIYRMIQALIYGAIGILFAQSMKSNLPYSALVRLSVIAVTPVLIVDTVLWMVWWQPRMWPLLCLIIAMCYLYFGVKAAGGTPAPPAVAGMPGAPTGGAPTVGTPGVGGTPFR
ncbi:MAG: DUF1189 family protein [Planctomycetota bacterium]|nr:DUF1189 family protein [Planctomycetota bacterium]